MDRRECAGDQGGEGTREYQTRIGKVADPSERTLQEEWC